MPVESSAPRLPRLERLLGCAVDEVSESTIVGLVTKRVREDLTLDFKQASYAGDRGADELAKDMAAFANAAGGMVIIGVAEDGLAASQLTPTAVDDGARRRLVEILARRVLPALPDLYVAAVPQHDDDGLGYLLLVVPPSPAAPHAVVSGHRLAWPVREDTTTRWMSEPEIAARYRDRFNGVQGRAQALDTAWVHGIGALSGRLRTWLCLAVSPDRAGRLAGGAVAVDGARRWLTEAQQELPAQAFSGAHAGVGRRKVVLGDLPGTARSEDWRLELHADGTAFGAIALGRPAVTDRAAPRAGLCLPIDDVEAWTVQLLGLLVRHSVRAGGGGDAAVRAQLLVAGEEPSALWKSPDGPSFSVGGLTVMLTEEHRDGGASFGQRPASGTRPVASPSVLDTATALTAASSRRDLILASYLVCADLLAEFGQPEPTVLASDGTAIPTQGKWTHLARWATAGAAPA